MSETEERIYGKNLVCICVNGVEQNDIQGELWTPYEEESMAFSNCKELLLNMDQLYDHWDFPQRTTSYRTFGKKDKTKDFHNPLSIRKREPIRSLKSFKGEKATFLVQVKFRQNATWQGTVIHEESNKKFDFTSAMGLVEIIDKSMSSN